MAEQYPIFTRTSSQNLPLSGSERGKKKLKNKKKLDDKRKMGRMHCRSKRSCNDLHYSKEKREKSGSTGMISLATFRGHRRLPAHV